MLFDLRGRGRRRTVRVIYAFLALIFLVGFVGFGVGVGGGGGGILNFLSEEKGGGGGGGYSSQITKYRKLTQKQPHNLSAWENLAKNLVHEAGQEKFQTSTGTPTSQGTQLFREAANAWSSYITLNPPKPNAELAQLMESVYAETGLNEPAKEVEILQIAIEAKPNSAALYGELAQFAYRAKNAREGDLATEKAVALAPANERKHVKEELEAIKKSSTGSSGTASGATASSGAATGAGGSSGAGATSSGSGTVTIGGKTYPIHVGATPTKKK
jgi:hypothetical protein